MTRLLGLLATLACLVACSAPRAATGPSSGSASKDTPSSTLSVEVSPRRPHPGQEATVSVTLVAHQDLNLEFPSSQRFDVMVFRDGDATPLWKWSDGRFFSQVVGNDHLAAGQRRAWQATWTPSAAGTYRVRGVVTARTPDLSVECPLTVA